MEQPECGYAQKGKPSLMRKINDIKDRLKRQSVIIALNIIRSATKDSNIKYHAEREFLAAGYIPLNKQQEDGPDKWIQQNVMDLLSVFSIQGHSGTSAPYCVNCFEKLASFKTLTPIKCDDSEWNDISKSCNSDIMFQNNRLSTVFKDGINGLPYYIDAIVFRDQYGITFTGSVDDSKGNKVSSRQFIKLPFTPKTFYIDVISTEYNSKEGLVEMEGGGWWTSIIKDESQLEKVFEYYVKEK